MPGTGAFSNSSRRRQLNHQNKVQGRRSGRRSLYLRPTSPDLALLPLAIITFALLLYPLHALSSTRFVSIIRLLPFLFLLIFRLTLAALAESPFPHYTFDIQIETRRRTSLLCSTRQCEAGSRLFHPPSRQRLRRQRRNTPVTEHDAITMSKISLLWHSGYALSRVSLRFPRHSFYSWSANLIRRRVLASLGYNGDLIDLSYLSGSSRNPLSFAIPNAPSISPSTRTRYPWQFLITP
jgi:hypothetical protein